MKSNSAFFKNSMNGNGRRNGHVYAHNDFPNTTMEVSIPGNYLPGIPGGFTKIMQSPKMQSVEDCINACNDNIKCLMWTFGSADGTCYLKDKVTLSGIEKADIDKYISGVADRYIENSKRQLMDFSGLAFDNGAPMIQFKANSVKQCEDAALYDPSIDAFQYGSKTGICKLRKGNVNTWTYDPLITSGIIFEEKDEAIKQWLKANGPAVLDKYHNWANKWSGEKTSIDNWLSQTYPQLKNEFEQWRSGLITGIPKYKEDYEYFLNWSKTKYPQYKAAYEKIKPYANNIPADKRSEVEEFIVWLVRKYPQFADRIFSDSEELYKKLKEWIALVAKYLQDYKHIRSSIGNGSAANGSAANGSSSSGSAANVAGFGFLGGTSSPGTIPMLPTGGASGIPTQFQYGDYNCMIDNLDANNSNGVFTANLMCCPQGMNCMMN